jgi:hypothetical protein
MFLEFKLLLLNDLFLFFDPTSTRMISCVFLDSDPRYTLAFFTNLVGRDRFSLVYS